MMSMVTIHEQLYDLVFFAYILLVHHKKLTKCDLSVCCSKFTYISVTLAAYIIIVYLDGKILKR